MNDAFLNSIFSGTVEPRGNVAGGGNPAQNAQGFLGHLGGSQGIPQGMVGSVLPQTGNTGLAALPSVGMGAGMDQNLAMGLGGAAEGFTGQQTHGLETLIPLLMMHLPTIWGFLQQLFAPGAIK